MNFIRIVFLSVFLTVIYSCADYKANTLGGKKEKLYYSSSGFALVYDEKIFQDKIATDQEWLAVTLILYGLWWRLFLM